MLYILIIIYLLSLFLISLLFLKIILNHKMKGDLAFFTTCNYLLPFTFILFFFHYQDYLFGLLNMLLIVLNTLFLTYEIKSLYHKYKLLTIPYLIDIIFMFYLIIDLTLMNQ